MTFEPHRHHYQQASRRHHQLCLAPQSRVAVVLFCNKADEATLLVVQDVTKHFGQVRKSVPSSFDCQVYVVLYGSADEQQLATTVALMQQVDASSSSSSNPIIFRFHSTNDKRQAIQECCSRLLGAAGNNNKNMPPYSHVLLVNTKARWALRQDQDLDWTAPCAVHDDTTMIAKEKFMLPSSSRRNLLVRSSSRVRTSFRKMIMQRNSHSSRRRVGIAEEGQHSGRRRVAAAVEATATWYRPHHFLDLWERDTLLRHLKNRNATLGDHPNHTVCPLLEALSTVSSDNNAKFLTF